jgi:hypothetical protein
MHLCFLSLQKLFNLHPPIPPLPTPTNLPHFQIRHEGFGETKIKMCFNFYIVQ